jgi:hypothetical protein
MGRITKSQKKLAEKILDRPILEDLYARFEIISSEDKEVLREFYQDTDMKIVPADDGSAELVFTYKKTGKPYDTRKLMEAMMRAKERKTK